MGETSAPTSDPGNLQPSAAAPRFRFHIVKDDVEPFPPPLMLHLVGRW